MRIDGIQLAQGSNISNLVVASGTLSFPSFPDEGELYFRTDSAANVRGLYVYINGNWDRMGSADSLTVPVGTSFPATANAGDLFYKDTNDAFEGLYVYNGSSWVVSGGSSSYTISGDVTGTIDGGTDALTLATVNSGPGSFGSSSASVVLTVNGKGLVTSSASTPIAIATSQVTSGTFADARIAQTNVTQHQSALTIAETQITDGTLLARVAGTETISGTWSFSNAVTGVDPTSSSHLTTKNYVDNALLGLSWKHPVRVATTTNITLSGTQTIDGVAVAASDRVLVKNQTTASQNGVYVVAAGAWTRATDFDQTAPIDEVNSAAVFVTSGSTQSDTGWTQTAPVTTIGTDAMTFVQFSAGGAFTAGAGLSQSGNAFNVGTASTARIVVNADDIDLATVSNSGTGTFLKVAADSYGRITGTTAVTTADITGLVDSTYVNINGDTMTGSLTSPAFIPSGATVPANGMYLAGANTLGFATNTTNRVLINSTGQVGLGVTPLAELHLDTATAFRTTIRLQNDNISSNIYSNIYGDGFGRLVFEANPLHDGSDTTMIFSVGGTWRGVWQNGPSAANPGYKGGLAVGLSPSVSLVTTNYSQKLIAVEPATGVFGSDAGTLAFPDAAATFVSAQNGNTTSGGSPAAGFLMAIGRDDVFSKNFAYMALVKSATAGYGGSIAFGASDSASSYKELLRLDTVTNNLLFGSTAARSVAGASRTLQIEGAAAQGSASFVRNSSSDIYGGELALGKTRGNTATSVTAVTNGDQLGAVQFAGADGTTVDTIGARIIASVNGSVSTGNIPTNLVFSTRNDAGTLQQRLSINSDGKIAFGNVTPILDYQFIGTSYGIGSSTTATLATWHDVISLSNTDAVANKRVLLTLPSTPPASWFSYQGTVTVTTGRDNNDNSGPGRATAKFTIVKSGGGTGTFSYFYVTDAVIDNRLSAMFTWYFDSTTGTPQLRFGQGANSYLWSVTTELTGDTVPVSLAVDSGSTPSGSVVSPNYTLANPDVSDGLTVQVGASERMRITSAGNVGIGETSPGSKLHVSGDIQQNNAQYLRAKIASGTTTRVFGVNASDTMYIGGIDAQLSSILFMNNGVEQARIASSGNTSIGVTGGNAFLGINKTTGLGDIIDAAGTGRAHLVLTAGGTGNTAAVKLAPTAGTTSWQMIAGTGSTNNIAFTAASSGEIMRLTDTGFMGVGTALPQTTIQLGGDSTYRELRLMRSSASANAQAMVFYKTRGTETAPTIVSGGDTLGSIFFVGNDGSAPVQAASVVGTVDATPGAGSVPGRLTFNTAPAGAGQAERMRIDSAGNVGIGMTPTNVLDITRTTVGSATIQLTNTSLGTGADARLILNNGAEAAGFILRGAASTLGASNAVLYVTGNNNLDFYTNGAVRARIDGTGDFLLGTTTNTASTKFRLVVAEGEGEPAAVNGDDFRVFRNSTSAVPASMSVIAGSAATAAVQFGDNATANAGAVRFNNATDILSLEVGGNAKFSVNSVGVVVTGSSGGGRIIEVAGGGNAGATNAFNVESTTFGAYSGISIALNDPTTAVLGGSLNFIRSRGTTVGSNTTVVTGDTLGGIAFSGTDGTDARTKAAEIVGVAEGTIGSSVMPGRLVFSTTGAGNGTPTERMRLTSAGNLGIGITPTVRLHVADNQAAAVTVANFGNSTAGTVSQAIVGIGSDTGGLQIGANSSTFTTSASFGVANETFIRANATATGLFLTTGAATPIRFSTNSVERMRLDPSGRVLVGFTSVVATTYLGGSATPGLSVFDAPGNAASGVILLMRNDASNAAATPVLSLGRSRNATSGSHTVVAVGDTLGAVNFVGSDGSAFREAAKILTQVDTGTPSATSMAGRLVFYTTPNASVTPVERMRIDSNGVIQDGAGNELGYKNIPPVSNSFVRGQANVITAGTTINTSAAGDVYSVYNNSSVSVTLTQGSGVTLRQGGTTNTGNRTLLPFGFATIWYQTSAVAVINGNIT